MMRCRRGEVYTYTTMVPPGKIKYFFTADKIAVYANSHPKAIRKVHKIIPDIEMYDEVKTYRISRFNYRIVEQSEVLNDCYMSLLKECVPRMRQFRYKSRTQYRVKEEWKVAASVFAGYIPDSQGLINKLFETDWSVIQKPKVNDEELSKVKEELKKSYWIIRDAFKYYASLASSTGSCTFGLSLNSFTEYLKQAGVYKSKTISFTDTDTLFFTTNKKEKATLLNPGNALIRYQFLEILMKLGVKYVKNKSPSESVKAFCNEIVNNSLKYGKAQEFRVEKYWNEYCDNVFRFHITLFKEVYDNFSGSLTKPGENRYMSPGEFEKIFILSNLLSSKMANREAYICFNLAMQARADEHSGDTHLKMSFVEFLEAIARAADMLSLAPPSEKIRNLYKEEIYADNSIIPITSRADDELQFSASEIDTPHMVNPENEEGADMTELEHEHQALHKKIDNMVPYLLAFCTTKAFKKKWKWPRKNPHTGLYTDVKEKGVREVKTMMVKGINKLIFSKLNFKEIVKRKRLNIDINSGASVS